MARANPVVAPYVRVSLASQTGEQAAIKGVPKFGGSYPDVHRAR